MLRAASGELPAAAIERYLASLRHVVAHSPKGLRRAADLALLQGRDELATYLEHKCHEEAGHDVWATADLGVLRTAFSRQEQEGPAPAVVELTSFLDDTIERDPALYLAYTVWAEYFTVLAGADLLRYLVERCGVPPSALTCLSNHIELDQEHADEGLEMVDDLVDDPRKLAEMRAVLRRTIELFDRSCLEMLEVPVLEPAAASRAS